MNNSIEQKIRDYIVKNFLFGDASRSLSDEDSFMQKGIIDSTGVLELVAFLQEVFDIRIEDDEILPDNLDSIQKLVGFIHRRTTVETQSHG